MSEMKIALGPLQYYWPRQTTLDFYAAAASLPLDIVYLGETVCSRRHELRLDDYFDLATQLAAAGKEVVLSSQTLIESESDLKALRRMVDNGTFAVEANEMGAVRLLAQRGIPFVAGPTLNIFNAQTLGLMADMGARRWVLPPEAGRGLLAGIQAGQARPVETEVFAYGRVPLAYSARCFTARRYNLQKDTCEFKCIEFPDGMTVRTREGEDFLTLNGIQTQSAKIYNLLHDLPDLAAAHVAVVRISPQAEGTESVIRAFRTVIDGQAAVLPGDFCNGFWHGQPGLELIRKAA